MRRLLLLAVLAVLVACGGVTVLAPQRDEARVVRVVDGDTIVVRLGGREQTVRLIGIDTPEVSPSECGNRAATGVLRRLAPPGRRVELVRDPSQDRRDRYGRVLAYVDTPAGRDLGEEVVRAGWARVYVFDEPFARLDDYRDAARSARRAGRGLSSACS